MKFRFDPSTYPGLDGLGRISLSKSFHMREFLYSEIAVHLGLRNVPENVDAAVHAGRQLCERLLEPLQDAFGRIHVRSGYRSPKVNEAGVEKYSCARDNNGFHVWDHPTTAGHGVGAVACISVPSISQKVLAGRADDLAVAWWIVDHLPDWSFMEFFATRPHSDELAFNIGWHERPFKTVMTRRGGFVNRSALVPDVVERKRLWEALTVDREL